MRFPGPASTILLAYLLVLLPWAALRSARRLRAAREGTDAPPLPSRQVIWTSTLIQQGVLLTLAWLTARTFEYEPFELPVLGGREVLAALGALALYFALRQVSRSVRSADERRAMTVYRIAPRGSREWALWSATVLAASVAEEVAYRGVGFQVLWYSLGDPWAATFVAAAAFALAHAAQGWKSGLVVFAMALVMHGLVWVTGSLIPAMVVHAVYDVVAGILIARQAARYDEEDAAAAEQGPATPHGP